LIIVTIVEGIFWEVYGGSEGWSRQQINDMQWRTFLQMVGVASVFYGGATLVQWVSGPTLVSVYGSTGGLGTLTMAQSFGIGSYRLLYSRVLAQFGRGSGYVVHHIIERRFAAKLGLNPQEMLCVVLTKAEHTMFTNAWLNAIGRRNMNSLFTTANVTRDDIWAAAQRIYANYPALLEAAKAQIGIQ